MGRMTSAPARVCGPGSALESVLTGLYPPSRRRHYATAGVRATSYILLRKGGLRQSRAAGDGPPGEFQTGDFREFQTGVDSSGRVSIVLPGTPAGELLVEQYAEQRFTAEKQRIV